MAEIINLSNRPFDLKKTLECGQTFFWHKENGKYYTVRNSGVLKVWQEGSKLFYENLGKDIDPVKVLRLDDPLDKIYGNISKDEFIKQSIDKNKGLRIINDRFFHCLTSFITSAQMRIPRIKKIQDKLAERYGEKLEFDRTYHQFPEPEDLAEVSEKDLRSVGLGYRAEYVKETARMISEGEVRPDEMKRMNYKEAKQEIMKLHGVGDKVGDCVLLFSLGFLEAFPIDTWIWKILEKEYPGRNADSYVETSKNMRDYFGKYAGYAHEYLYHYSRTSVDFD